MTPEEELKRRITEAEKLKQWNAAAAEAQKEQSIRDAIAYGLRKPKIEKRRRDQAAANTPEAWAKRNDFDPHSGE
jgi:hypothetical protein